MKSVYMYSQNIPNICETSKCKHANIPIKSVRQCQNDKKLQYYHGVVILLPTINRWVRKEHPTVHVV